MTSDRIWPKEEENTDRISLLLLDKSTTEATTVYLGMGFSVTTIFEQQIAFLHMAVKSAY